MTIPEHWYALADQGWRSKLEAHARKRNYKRAAKRNHQALGLSEDEAYAFVRWLATGESSAAGNDIEDNTDGTTEDNPSCTVTEHDRGYWYDESRDTYVCHLPSHKRPMAIGGETIRAIRQAYSNWDGVPESLAEVCRKFGIAKHTLRELLRCLDVTHASAPWTDETLTEESEDDLVQDLLRQKEERVITRAERAAWTRIKRDAEIVRSLDLLASRLAERFNECPIGFTDDLDIEDPEACTLVLSPTDWHYGKLGVDGYDHHVAVKRLMSSTQRLLQRFEHRPIKRIVVALGGDGLNIDNMNRTTTRGTPQTTSAPVAELAMRYVMICAQYVLTLSETAPVSVFVVPGNHDKFTCALLRGAMGATFANHDRITVELTPSTRKYVSIGASLVAFTHGDVGKVADYPQIMACEVPQAWGRATFRYIMTGHLHTERELPQKANVTVYRMPSLSGACPWEEEQGYANQPALIGYVFNDSQGLVSTEIARCDPA